MTSINQSRRDKLEFAKRMIEKLEAALLSGAGVVSVSTDGVSVTYNRKQALSELEMWRKQVVRYSRSKSRSSTIRLDNSQ